MWRAFGSALVFSILACVVSAAPLSDWVLAAGNADSDGERVAILREAAARIDLSDPTRADLKVFLKFLDRWQHGENLKWFRGDVERERHFDFKLGDGSELRPLADLYYARMQAWVILASGAIWNNPEIRRERCAELRVNLERLTVQFPENRILKMYLGQPYPAATTYAPAPGAPAWAVYQREAIERQREIVHWLIDHRQQPGGEYGAGWGDDCEMWRLWLPVLLAFEDPKIIAAQERLSSGLLNQPYMRGGYTDFMTDVEHTAEDTADTITPMIHLAPESADWSARALRIVDLARTSWTGVNDRGLLQFKSCYFTVDAIDMQTERASASVYECRTLQPGMLLWQRTRDPALGEFFIHWLDGWHAASMQAEHDKPAGIIPTAVHWPDGTAGGAPADWWEPDLTPGDPLYFWPSAMPMLTQSLVLGWHMTGDAKYLEPLRAMAGARRAWLAQPEPNPAPGTLRWCGMRMRGLREAVSKYRLLSHSTEFDDLLADDSGPYLRFLLTGDDAPLETALRNQAATLRDFFPGFTSEVRITDRTMRFPTLFTKGALYDEPLAGVHLADPQLVFSTLTGEPGDGLYFPLMAVRWLTEPHDFAALVRKSDTGTLEADVFHFGRETREMEVALFLLAPGPYRFELVGVDTGGVLSSGPLAVTGRDDRLALELPSRRLVRLRISGT